MQSPNKLYASIDVGTNSALLLIAKVGHETLADEGTRARLEPCLEKLYSVRLGEDLKADSEEISVGADAKRRLLDAMYSFRQVIHNLGAEVLAITFTEALRKAVNQAEILEEVNQVFELHQVQAKLLTGPEEAFGSWLGIAHYYNRLEFVSLDIGAGSTELSTREDRISIPVGALRIFKESGPIPGDSIRDWLLGQTEEVPWDTYKGLPIYLCGGTATALAALNLKLDTWDGQAVESYPVDFHLVQRTTMRLADLSSDVRNGLPGLDKGRGDLIIPGLRILEVYIEKINPEVCRVTNLGLRYGIMVQALSERGILENPLETQ